MPKQKKKHANRKPHQQQHQRGKKIQSNVKDRLFRYLFEKDREALLDLYNALNGTGMISLPTPQCIVFYNGMKEMPEEGILKLSDAFENKKVQADVELTVRMLNINHGHNQQLMEKCRVLEEYSAFVAVTRACMFEEKDIQTALNRAVDECIEKRILREFLLRNRAEVLGMLLEEFDAEKYERTIRGEGREEGRKEGRKEGLKIGIRYCIEILQETCQPREYAKQKIMEKYTVSEEEAERELLLYWK